MNNRRDTDCTNNKKICKQLYIEYVLVNVIDMEMVKKLSETRFIHLLLQLPMLDRYIPLKQRKIEL